MGPRMRAQAELLLERYGIVTRETVLAEGIPGGLSTLYGELSNLEMLGTARRGYFVEGQGGAQFALAGAVERLRSLPRVDDEYLVLAVTDPANPYGSSLSWPKRPEGRRPARTAGAYLLTRNGNPLLYVERGGRGILRLAGGRGAGAGRRRHAARRGVAGGGDPEARDRAARRRARDRLAVRRGPPRGGLQPPAAAPRRVGRPMPEGDTIHRAARRMDAALRGREMVLADAPNPRSPIHGRAKKLEGSVLERVEARGKHLLAHFSTGDVIHSHLGMNGRWFIAADGPDALRQAVAGPLLGPGHRLAERRQASSADLGVARPQRPGPGAARTRTRSAARSTSAEAAARLRRHGRRARDRRRPPRPADHRGHRQRDPQRGAVPRRDLAAPSRRGARLGAARADRLARTSG